jgi:hypothetical protein
MELMVGLGIVMLLVGLGTQAGRFWSQHREMRKPMDDMKSLAKKAHHRAIAEQRDWEIVIRTRSLELRPKQAASEADAKFFEEADEALKRGPGVEYFSYDEDVLLAVRRFGETEFAEPRPDYWVFKHTGICEPLVFRVERGERWMEAQFDPLTAGVQYESGE